MHAGNVWRGDVWRNETWVNETVTMTRGEMKRFMHVHSEKNDLDVILLTTSTLMFAHAMYCLFLISGRVYKTIETRVRLRIWGSNVFFAIFFFIELYAIFGIVSFFSDGPSIVNLVSAGIFVFAICAYALGFVVADRIAADHGVPVSEALDFDLLKWFRTRSARPELPV